MGGSRWLFLFLFVLPLVSPLSIDDANCPETQACLLLNLCKDNVQSISYMESEVNTNFACKDGDEPSWTVFRFDPISENEWLIEIYSNRTEKIYEVSFADQNIAFYKIDAYLDGSLENEIKVKEVKKKGVVADKITLINMTSDKSIYDQLMNGNISSPKKQGILLEVEENMQFKTKVFDLLHPCDISQLNDECETEINCMKIYGNSYKAKCNATFWVNNGTSANPDYQSIETVICKNRSWIANEKLEIDKRGIICTDRNPNDDICKTQEIENKCLYNECHMIVSAKNITCTDPNTKFWIVYDQTAEGTNLVYCKENKWIHNNKGDIKSLRDSDRFLCSEIKPEFCEISKLNDVCETKTDKGCKKMTANFTQAQCDLTIWVNNGSAEQSNFIKVDRINCEMQDWIAVIENSKAKSELLGDRNTLCSANEPKQTQKEEINGDSDFCDHRHLNEKCGDSCDLKMAHNNVTCPTKLWIDTGNSAFTRHWLSVNQIKCKNGEWKWKHDSGTDWNSIGKMEVACSATSLPQTKPLLYGTVGGSIGLLIIILIVAIILYKRRSKTSVVITNTEKSKTNTEKSTDKGSLILGVAVDPSKAEMKTWNWPEETEGTQIGSRPEAKTPPSRPDQNVANSPQPEALTETPGKNVKDTKFINVTESPTKNSSRKARRSKGKTVNVTESPKNSSRKARRPKGKTGDVPESPKNSSKKIHRPKGKTSDVNVSPKRKSDRPKKGKTTREDVLW